jgi:hypothetical protein
MGTKLDKTSRLQFELIDAVAEGHADVVDQLQRSAISASQASSVAKAANGDKRDSMPTVWAAALALAETVCTDTRAEQLDGQQLGDVFSTVILDALTGKREIDGQIFDLEPAQKTVKAYLSTGRKVITAVKEGRNNWHQFQTKLVKQGDEMKEESVSYDEVRDMLKSDGQKQLDEVADLIVRSVKKVRGKETDARSVSARLDQLQSILEAIEPYVASADKAAEEKKRTTGRGAAAAAASELIQQQPRTAATVEVTKAA